MRLFQSQTFLKFWIVNIKWSENAWCQKKTKRPIISWFQDCFVFHLIAQCTPYGKSRVQKDSGRWCILFFWIPTNNSFWLSFLLTPGRCDNYIKFVILRHILLINSLNISSEIALRRTGHHQWEVNIGSGNGLVPLGNKPLTAPMLTQI